MNSPAPIQLRLSLHRGDFHLSVDTVLPGSGVTAIFGPSGCGKTSLLRAIAGLEDANLDPEHSRIQVDGQYWFGAGQHLPTYKRGVGYVFQEASLFDHLSVAGNLAFGRKRNPHSPVRQEDIVRLLDIEPLLARATTHLSGGERQRVAIGRALLAGPRLLLMDEPLAALDQARKQEILPYLKRLGHFLAIPILYVSHAVDEVVQLADHLVLMDAGKIRAQGPVTTLLTEDPLLAQREDAFCLIKGQLLARGEQDAVRCVQLGRHTLRLTDVQESNEREIRLRVYAKDVSLCLDYPQRTSILNVLPARVLSLEEVAHGQSLVHLELEGQKLLARISRLSAQQLELTPGKAVYAQIKAAALDRSG